MLKICKNKAEAWLALCLQPHHKLWPPAETVALMMMMSSFCGRRERGRGGYHFVTSQRACFPEEDKTQWGSSLTHSCLKTQNLEYSVKALNATLDLDAFPTVFTQPHAS